MLNIINLIFTLIAIACGFLMLWKIPFLNKDQNRLNIPKNTKVTLIIPAYNEEKRLPNLLRSLQKQDYTPHQILVVDDHSKDNTSQIAKNLGATVISSLDLQDGWIGKSRACWSGALSATGEWFMFIDADVFFQKENSLRKILEEFYTLGQSGILSLQPYHLVKRKYESLAAIFNIIVPAGMNIFTPWGKKEKSAGAFGPVILCTKKQYFSSGGHLSIKGAVMDDLELGRSFIENGFPVNSYAGKNVVSFRMYPEGIKTLFEGFTKNFGTASQSTNIGVFMMIIVWISGGFTSTFLLVNSIIKGNPLWIVLGSILYILFSIQIIWQARRFGNFYLPFLIFYPILFIFFTIIFSWSLIKTKIFRSVSWRGRKIDV